MIDITKFKYELDIKFNIIIKTKKYGKSLKGMIRMNIMTTNHALDTPLMYFKNLLIKHLKNTWLILNI